MALEAVASPLEIPNSTLHEYYAKKLHFYTINYMIIMISVQSECPCHIILNHYFYTNPFNSEFTIVILIHYKPRIAVAILDLQWMKMTWVANETKNIVIIKVP